MALFFIRELYAFSGQKNTAGSKARDDVDAILSEIGICPIEVLQTVRHEDGNHSLISIVARRITAKKDWSAATSTLVDGDTLLIQVPIRNHSYGVAKAIARLSHRGVHIIPIVHDLELIRFAKAGNRFSIGKYLLMAEEKMIIKSSASIIVHNDEMVDLFGRLFGEEVKKRTTPLGLFDYLLESNSPIVNVHDASQGVAIAGNLDRKKAGYVYMLPGDCPFVLYGINYEGGCQSNVLYRGAFSPENLPSQINESFGLVWDGPSPLTCTGVYGDYLRFNNPHKASFYLSCGIPIVIWDQAALASIVTDRRIGVTVSSLDELGAVIEGIDDGEYCQMKRNAETIASSLREGRFLVSAVEAALKICGDSRP